MILMRKNQFGQPIGQEISNWVIRKYPARIEMQGNYCTLTPINIDEHAKPLFEVLHNNPGDAWTYLPYGPFPTEKEFIEWLRAMELEKDTILYAILDSKTKTPTGISGYLRMDPDNGVIEVGHLHFSQSLKRTIAATEAMYLMMRYVFDDLGYRRYEWKCDALNYPSRHAAERLGFKLEGVFRQHKVMKNRNRDTAWFSILDGEWLSLKEKFNQWLNPANFDEKGQQLSPLR